MRIGLTGIVVDDQDNNAKRFYTHVLGLKAKTNAPYAAPGAGRPWCPCDLVGGGCSG